MAFEKGRKKTGGRVKGGTDPKTIAKATERVEYIKATVDRVLEEYGRIAFLDLRRALDEDGNLKPLVDWPEDLARSVAAIDLDPFGKPEKVKFWNKNSALDSVAKHLGMFVERFAGADGKSPIEVNIGRQLLRDRILGTKERIGN